MSIHTSVQELYGVDAEMASLRKRLRELRTIKNKLESEIKDYILKHNTEVITFRGNSIILRDQKNVHKRSKDDRIRDIQALLSKHGVRDVSAAANEIVSVQNGRPTITQKVKIVSPKKGDPGDHR
jgi:hypothetical protein